MRLFIAINFDDNTKDGLSAMRDELHSRSQRGNFNLTENLHLTLAFLGECTEKQTAAAKATMDTIRFSAFEIAIDRVGQFKREGGDIWWVGVREDKQLLDMQRKLVGSLTTAGFELDKRKYSPHITLGRSIITDAAPWAISPFGQTICKIDLMKSERIQGKLTYTAIYTV